MVRFEERTLENGLSVVLAPDPATPVVAVNIWYRVGSRDETAGRTGFAHLFEHLMFQGSLHVAKNEYFQRIEEAGGSANASTWFDRTNYYAVVPAHHLELPLWLESDRMGWMLPAITDEKLENQRSVVLNERSERYENQPYGDWDERVQRLLFPEGHPYRHPVIGHVADIGAATMDDVRSFFEAYYHPANARLTICGAFDPEEAWSAAEKYFGEIPGRPPAPLPSGELEDVLEGPLRDDVTSKVPLPKAYIAFRAPPFAPRGDFYAGEAVSECLGGGRTSRLHDRLVRTGKLKSASCHLLPLVGGVTMFLVVGTGFAGMSVREVEALLGAELDDLGSLTERERRRVLLAARRERLEALQRAGERADLLSMYGSLFGDPGLLNRELAQLERVTLEEMRAWSASHAARERRVVVRYTPRGAE